MANAIVSKHVNHYQTITNSILAALQQGVNKWRTAHPGAPKGHQPFVQMVNIGRSI
jgi:hypothetical protein